MPNVQQPPDERPAPAWHLGYTEYDPERDAELNKAAARTHYERLARQATSHRTAKRAGVATARALLAMLVLAVIVLGAFRRLPW